MKRALLLTFVAVLATAGCSDSGPSPSATSGDASAFCAALRATKRLPRSVTKADVDKAYDQLVATAPGEIKADVAKVAAAAKTSVDLRDQLSAHPESQNELEESLASTAVSTGQEGQNIGRYATTHCTSTASGSSSPSSG